MKKICCIACLLLMILLLPVAVSAEGNISVSSSPTGATIYLNGTSTGSTTPFTVESVPAGSHTILLQKSGYADYSQNVTVVDNQTSTVSVTLTATVPAPTITGITPSSGYNTSVVSITNLAGTGFLSGASVVLTKSGETNITATSVSVASATQITCSFGITGKTAGTWNVVVTNTDGKTATLTDGFTIIDAGTTATLSSITPASGTVNTTITISNLAGSNFLSNATFLLRRTGYNDIPGTVTSRTSTTNIAGTFDLNGRTPGAYQVCLINSATDTVCGLTFSIDLPGTVSPNGSIYFTSSPTSAKIFLNQVYKGTTSLTLDNITPGTYAVLIQKTGYKDWSSSNIQVTAGNTTDVNANLQPEETYTTVATAVPTTRVTTVKTTVKSTLKTPTPWPTATPTPASSFSTLAIIGALGLGLIVLRKS